MPDASMTMIDLFAGAGGLSLGLEMAGFHSIYANEYIKQFAQTYAVNHPDGAIDSRDIRDVDPRQTMAELGMAPKELTLLAGGPPCQGFSVNAPRRSLDDHRNHLFNNYLEFVRTFKPRAVLIENVPGLVSFESGATLDAILTALKKLEYDADVQILYAPHYGVPQTRWRTIIIGIRKDVGDVEHVFPLPVHDAPARVNFTSSHRSKNLVPFRTDDSLPAHTSLRDALADLPSLTSGGSAPEGADYASFPQNAYQEVMRRGSTGVFNHRATNLSAINLARLSHIPPGGNWTDIPFDMLPAGMQRARRSDHTKRYGRNLPSGLASTVLTKCDPHWGAFFHYEQDRTFSVREAARIQSFPDRYIFAGTLSEQYAQVGNAVPPMMAKAIGESLADKVSGTAIASAVRAG